MKLKRLWQTEKGDRIRILSGPWYGREAEVRDLGHSGFGSVQLWIAGLGIYLLHGEDLQTKVDVLRHDI